MKNRFNHSKYLVITYCISVAFTVGDEIINTGTVKVSAKTEVSMHSNYTNKGTYTNEGVTHIRKNLINNGTYTNDGVTYIYENLTNNGTINYSPTRTADTVAITQFVGAAYQQTIKGSGTSEYYNIQFNKTSGSISLKKEINIFGEIDFTKGIIQESSGGLVIFKSNATVTNVSDSSFVDGKVRKIGKQSFVFPIGDEKGRKFIYRMAKISAPKISAPEKDTDVFEAEYFWQNSNSTYPHNSKERNIGIGVINKAEYWKIDRISGKSDVEVTLSWNSKTTHPDIIKAVAAEGKLGIVRWNQNSKKWINEEGKADLKAKTITTTPKGFGIFTLAIINADIDIDIDGDGDGVTDAQENLDGTNPKDSCDFLAGNDAISQSIEFLNGDCDSDNVPNKKEANPPDTDNDGIPDYLDPDDDGDGINTIDEDTNGDGDPTNDDTDNNGIPNYLDPDDDGDGINTIDEDTNGDGDPTNDDANRDGIPDYLENDYSNKTIPVSEAFTPNGDGVNDLFVIKNIEILYPDFELIIVNRYGNTLYHYKHNGDSNKIPIWWGGAYIGNINLVGGDKAPTGTYFYTIRFNNTNIKNQTGWVYLQR